MPGCSTIRGVQWIDDPKAIVMHYARSWMAFDLLATIPPPICDFLPLAITERDQGLDAGGQHAADQLVVVRYIRVLRIGRLVRLMRLLRASRIFKRCLRKGRRSSQLCGRRRYLQ